MEPAERHVPVLVSEVLEALGPVRGGLFVDCTVGMGGHAEALLGADAGVRLIGIDRDAESLDLARRRLEPFRDRVRTVHADYREIARVLESEAAGEPIAGILADLGISSHQLDDPQRGLSFTRDAPLDMRMDRSCGETAANIVARLPETELADLIYGFGEERRSRRIARAICREREREPILTTVRLAEIVARASGIPRHKQRIHPATQTFRALRIAVNGELDGLGRFIEDSAGLLESSGGRLAIISFHSLEDRIVKRTLNALSGHCSCPPGFPVCVCGARAIVRVLTRKPVVASDREVLANPRSRSAKLRAAERL